MSNERSGTDSSPGDGSFKGRTPESVERELILHRRTENRLRAALARKEALLRRRNALIFQRQILGRESDHRLLNGLQMIASVLRLQSCASADSEVASQLTAAANRVDAIGRVHRRLHSLDGAQTVAFGKYLEDLCHDFSAMLSPEYRAWQIVAVEAVDGHLPTDVGIPLAFIVNELVTNAAKHGKGPITVRFEQAPPKGYALSVSNDGSALPDGFDPTTGKGLGMQIVRSFVGRIGGELRISRGREGRGSEFSVLFS